MYKAQLNKIKDTILTYNTYFNEGYANVVTDPVKGVHDGKEIIFPNDKLGDYFYFRLPNAVTMGYTNGDNFISIPVILVAVVKNADTDKLITNLVATLQNVCGESISIIGFNINREDVVRTELSSVLSATELSSALAKISNRNIVSVSFTLSDYILKKPLSCIVNPCVC